MNLSHHTCRPRGGPTYDVARLIAAAAGHVPELVPIAPLLEGWPWQDPDSGFDWDRFWAADPSYPVLIRPDGVLLDGRHRLARLLAAGAGEALAVRLMTEDLKAARIPEDMS